ncbi:MAG: hypothetical protein WB799_03985 [Candidatus Sulfotelmatobacter sp.]
MTANAIRSVTGRPIRSTNNDAARSSKRLPVEYFHRLTPTLGAQLQLSFEIAEGKIVM